MSFSQETFSVSPKASLAWCVYVSLPPFLPFSEQTPQCPCPTLPATGRCSGTVPGRVGKQRWDASLWILFHHLYLQMHGGCGRASGESLAERPMGTVAERKGAGLSLFHEPVSLYGQSQANRRCYNSSRATTWGCSSGSSFALSWASVFTVLGWAVQTQHARPWVQGVMGDTWESQNNRTWLPSIQNSFSFLLTTTEGWLCYVNIP